MKNEITTYKVIQLVKDVRGEEHEYILFVGFKENNAKGAFERWKDKCDTLIFIKETQTILDYKRG